MDNDLAIWKTDIYVQRESLIRAQYHRGNAEW